MKAKLNLTIEKNLVRNSKEYARKHGISVSRLIEILLKENITESNTSFSEKWQGKFRIISKEENRFKKLEERYFS